MERRLAVCYVEPVTREQCMIAWTGAARMDPKDPGDGRLPAAVDTSLSCGEEPILVSNTVKLKLLYFIRKQGCAKHDN